MDDRHAATPAVLRKAPRRWRSHSARGSGCGEPELAKAPPSITTSFCMSWMMSAQRDASSLRSPGASAPLDVADEADADVAFEDDADPRARMNGSLRGPTLTSIGIDRGASRRRYSVRQSAPPQCRLALQFGDRNLADVAARPARRPTGRPAPSPRHCPPRRISCRRARRASCTSRMPRREDARRSPACHRRGRRRRGCWPVRCR